MGLVGKILAREACHPVLSYPWFLFRVADRRKRYAGLQGWMRKRRGKLLVVFLTAGPSKWKCQSVYDEMARSSRFRPVVVCPESDVDFYRRNGCDGVVTSLGQTQPDIVFYQDPWSELAARHPVSELSRKALCCYVPYSIESISDSRRSERFDYHHLANFHSLMFACFQWSPDYADHYARAQKPREWAGTVQGFGHPTLDAYYDHAEEEGGGLVIYAPHFSFSGGRGTGITDIGTFDWSGRALLDYAQLHPEIKWAFKPHPKLRARLVENGHMTEAEADAYYRAWERVGVACYDGNYAGLFLASRAMITDSNSFLLEYMAVGKPLVHLVPRKCKMVACPQARAVFDTFYRASDESEMRAALHLVLERGEDPLGAARRAAAEHACVLGNHAGRRIVSWLLEQCGEGGT